jgi:hypothetical protein
MGRWYGGTFYEACRTCEPFDGFQWRSVDALKINYFWLQHYLDAGTNCGAWFDDLVIAKKYIGPMVNEAVSVGKSAGKPSFPGLALEVCVAPEGSVKFAAGIEKQGAVGLTVYDARGSKVWEYRGTAASGGRREIGWDGRTNGNASPAEGVFAAVLQQDDGKQATRRFALVR